MKPDVLLKSIAKAVKAKDELSCVTCIYSNKRDLSQNPVVGFTLCLGVGNVKYQHSPDDVSPVYSTEIKLCLLAPLAAEGKRLSEVTHWIAETLRESFPVNFLQISEPKYNDTTAVLYSDIDITITDESLWERGWNVYIDDKLTEGLLSFEIKATEEEVEIPRLLNGYAKEKTGEKEITLVLNFEKPIFFSEGSFDVSLLLDGYMESYKCCSVKEQKRKLTNTGKLSFVYELEAGSFEDFGRVEQ